MKNKLLLVLLFLVAISSTHSYFASVATSARRAMPAVINFGMANLSGSVPVVATSLNFTPTNLPKAGNLQQQSSTQNYLHRSTTNNSKFVTQSKSNMLSNSFMSQLKKMTFNLPTQQKRNISSGSFTPQYQQKEGTIEGAALHESAHAVATIFSYTDRYVVGMTLAGKNGDGSTINWNSDDKLKALQSDFAKNNTKKFNSTMVDLAGIVAQQMFDVNYKYYHPAAFTDLEDILKMVIDYNNGFIESYGIGKGDFTNIYSTTSDYDGNASTEQIMQDYAKFNSINNQLMAINHEKWQALPKNLTEQERQSVYKKDSPEEIKLLAQLYEIESSNKQRRNQQFIETILKDYPLTYRFLKEYKNELFTVKNLLLQHGQVDGKAIYQALEMHHPLDYSGEGEHSGAQQFAERAFNPSLPQKPEPITDPARLLSASSESSQFVIEAEQPQSLIKPFNSKNLQANINQLSPEVQHELYQQKMKQFTIQLPAMHELLKK